MAEQEENAGMTSYEKRTETHDTDFFIPLWATTLPPAHIHHCTDPLPCILSPFPLHIQLWREGQILWASLET